MVDGLVTVPESTSDTVSPPARVPTENVIVSTVLETAAVAAGAPETVVTTTALAEIVKLPVSVITSLSLF